MYGFRIVVDNFANCYVALGTLHALRRPRGGAGAPRDGRAPVAGQPSAGQPLAGQAM